MAEGGSGTVSTKAVTEEIGHSAPGSHNNYALLLPEGTKLIMEATAYTMRPEEGTADGITYTGTSVKPGVVAVDPNIIPLGSWLYIQSDFPYITGYYRAEDTGKAIRGNRVDIYIPEISRAMDFGRRKVEVMAIND